MKQLWTKMLIGMCRAVTRILPQYSGIRIVLGRTLLQNNHINEACRQFRLAVNLVPDNVIALDGFSDALMAADAPDDAVTVLERAVSIDPTQSSRAFRLANARFECGDAERALQAYKLALQLEPLNGRAYFNMGHTYKELGQLEMSAQAFANAVYVKPRFYKARFMRAHVLTLMGHLPEAVQEYQRTIRDSPKYVKAHYNLGNCHFQEERFELAVESYERVTTLDSTYNKAFYALGQAWLQLDQLEQARVAFVQALRLRADMHSCRFQLASLLDEQGRSAEAVMHYRVFLRDSPPSKEHVLVQARLDAINNLHRAAAEPIQPVPMPAL
ncbi:MAG TPA: tetratricopeptide repeat protein [Myxococcales bacterium]|nr:tetratricopeptide repeat protein [Myxococcales bacterium]